MYGLMLVVCGIAVLKHRIWWVLAAPGFFVAMRVGTVPPSVRFSHVYFYSRIWAGQLSFFASLFVLGGSFIWKAYRVKDNVPRHDVPGLS